MKPINEISYNEALKELGEIITSMQSNNCDIDKLAANTRRATELIAECRRRLTATEQELDEIFNKAQQ